MSVRVTRTKNGKGWLVDLRTRLADGSHYRERRKAPTPSKTAARRWGEERERHLAIHGLSKEKKKEVPTLSEFWPRFIENHCRANRHKPSGIAGKESTFKAHLGPLFGKTKLDQLKQEDVNRLKRRLIDKKPATVNNALTVLSQLLKCAVEWEVIGEMPVKIRLLKIQKTVPEFYDFDEFEWLVEAARKIDPRTELLVLLGGEAGLRRGEILALEWHCCDLRRGLLKVQASEWDGKVTETKGMESRIVPMTTRLQDALRAHKHLRGDRVLYADEVGTPTNRVVRNWMRRAQKRAGLKANGGIHLLRHTFCSRLAMRGVPALAIQKLAGHKNMQTTLRYMHLSPGETHRAIALLEDRHHQALQYERPWSTDHAANHDGTAREGGGVLGEGAPASSAGAKRRGLFEAGEGLPQDVRQDPRGRSPHPEIAASGGTIGAPPRNVITLRPKAGGDSST